jgi:hypothetical protein
VTLSMSMFVPMKRNIFMFIFIFRDINTDTGTGTDTDPWKVFLRKVKIFYKIQCRHHNYKNRIIYCTLKLNDIIDDYPC